MEKKYNPLEFEESIYENWLKNKYFYANNKSKKTPYCIIMPPPNITSHLHMGHAFQQTIQDIIIRRKRMQGFEVLWLPGTDHAAIATEAKIVENLALKGVKKEDLGRDKFAEHVNEWYEKYKNTIINQFKRMGFSCDWDRLNFTMDEQNCRAVRHVFVHLYKKGYIYKGKRIVNWCPSCKTSISDAEVDFKENHGYLWYIKYNIEGTGDYLTVATTRPETMLGDTALAINPKDSRYKKLIGKNVIVPTQNRIIPIIADDYVEKDFGTGVVKITPSHDANDFEVGLRHNLPQIQVIDAEGKMTKEAGEFAGLDRFIAREKIVSKLKILGNLEKIEKYNNNVSRCDRCKTIIEPLTSDQWFVKMKDLAKPAIEVVENDEVHFIEKKYKKIYLHWMKNIKDWCISRQLWSGHRIPIFICKNCGEVIVEEFDPTKCIKCGSSKLIQELDSLDTWFSSALWPLSTLGFPDKSRDLEFFYPTDLMVTAQEIIQLWVARMIFSGLEYVGKIPFKDVLINGTVKDIYGKKMSKSLGNGIDPIELIEKYGVDALRFSLFNGISIQADCRFSEKKVELTRNFINKIWNASYFVITQTKNIQIMEIDKINLSDNDKWILFELNALIKDVNVKFDKYEIGLAASSLYDFFWNKFCDWYIETAKITIKINPVGTASTLVHVLSTLLKLLHPFIPFVTEKIYSELPIHEKTIMFSSYPKINKIKVDIKSYKNFESLKEIIKSIRNARAELKVADNKKTKLYILPLKEERFIMNNITILEKLSNSKNVEITDNNDVLNSTVCLNELLKVFIPNDDLIDKKNEMERLNKELQIAINEIKRAEGKLNNAGFISKAPQNLIDAEHEKIKKYTLLKTKYEQSIKEL